MTASHTLRDITITIAFDAILAALAAFIWIYGERT